MIRVLNIISDANIGGAGRVLLNYLRCADRMSFETGVVLPRNSALLPRLRELDVPVYEVDGMADRSLAPKAVPELCRAIGDFQPDLVHTHGSLSGRVAARLKGRKIVYTRHCAFPPGKLASSPPGRLANRVMDACLSNGAIALGDAARDMLVQTGIPERKIRVLLNGVAPLPAPTTGERERSRARFGFGPEDFVLGILARIEPYKGHEVLLDAAGALLEQGRRVKVLIAGSGSAEPGIRLKAAGLPSDTVIFAGFVEQVEEVLWAMDVQVNASTESEASNLSLLEGMSMGLPAIASDVGGNPLHIFDGENGLLVPRGDSLALARAASRLMDSPEELERMRRRALEIYQSRFTGEAFARNIEDFYRNILKGENQYGI